MEQHDNSKEMGYRNSSQNEKQESSSKTGTVSSFVPSIQSVKLQESGFKKLCRNQPESCQHIHSMHRKCPTTNCNGSANSPPSLDRDRIDGKMPPVYPNMPLGKLTSIANHYARVVTNFGEVQRLISPTTLKLCSATNLTFDYVEDICFICIL